MQRVTAALLMLIAPVACAEPSRQAAATAPAAPPSASTPPSPSASTPTPEPAEPLEAPEAGVSDDESVPEPQPAPDLGDEPVIDPATARGGCVDRVTLRTRDGDVSCYPYHCLGDRCGTTCRTQRDCAYYQGDPGGEGGWPLRCGNAGRCVPLPPRHVPP